MVILLSGTQSINKKNLSRIIMSQLNTFEHNGYTCDFSHGDMKIYNSEGVLVYQPSTIEGGIVKQDENLDLILDNTKKVELFLGEDDGVEDILHTHPEIIEHFNNVAKEVFDNWIKYNHFINRFCSLDIDFGLTETPRYLKDNGVAELLHPSNFEDVVNNIKSFPYNTKVITGTFGDYFIKHLKESLPDEEVHVINIIRNPSVAWLMDKNPDLNWNVTNISADQLNTERFFQSAITAMATMNTPGVITVRFEDLIASGKLTIGDKTVNLTEDYLAYNNWLNNYEGQREIIMSAEELLSFNKLASNYTFEDFYNEPDDIDEEADYGLIKTEIFDRIAKHFPKNIFANFGYEPLTKDEILKK